MWNEWVKECDELNVFLIPFTRMNQRTCALFRKQESIKVCKALALNATQYGVARPDMIVKQIERVADDLGFIVTWFLFIVNLSVNEGTLLITDIVD